MTLKMDMNKFNSIVRQVFVLIGLTTIFSFSYSKSSYQTECVTLETDGYVTIKIWNTKTGASYKAEQARKDAVHAILYAGISGGNGCSTQPPILNKSEEQDNFKKIEKSFFSKKGKWYMFTRSSATISTLPANLGIQNWKVYQVSISKNELRKFLEEQKIIKSLTNGF